MFKFHFLAGCRHCTQIYHPHVRRLRILVVNNTLDLESTSSRKNQLKKSEISCRKSQTLSLKLHKYYVTRNFCSEIRESSFNNTISKNFDFNVNNEENIDKESVPVPGASDTSSSGSKPTLLNKNSSSKDAAFAIDESFLQELLSEYETVKSIMFKETVTSTPATHDTTSASAASAKVPEAIDTDAVDVFGAEVGVLKEVPVFEEDEKDEEKLTVQPPLNIRERQYEYDLKLQALCNEKDLEGAFTMLEKEMPEEKVKPTDYHFRILIGACAKLGLVDEAFRLFAQLKSRGYTQKPLLYSYLFIACTNARDPCQHVQRITDLRAKMAELQMVLSMMDYNAMLLAFGRCGAVETAFEVFEEMLSNHKNMVSTRSFNSLMTACISDREVGFRYAIVLWQKMRAMNIKPDIYSFNLLLRCAVECKCGDPALLLKLFQEMSESNPLPLNSRNISNKNKYFRKGACESMPRNFNVVDVFVSERDVPSSRVVDNKTGFRDSMASVESDVSLNKLADKKQRNTSKVSKTYFDDSFSCTEGGSNSSSKLKKKMLSDESAIQNDQFSGSLRGDVNINGKITRPIDARVVQQTQGVHSRLTNASEDPVTALMNTDEPPQRLMLLGGLSGVMNSMAAHRVRPNMKTFLTLLWVLPDTLDSEQELLRVMKDINVKPSTTFCNMLIKKRCRRGDYALAKSTLSLLSEHRLSPDIITYGCLALGCHTSSDAKELLTTMSQQGGCPNSIIMLNLVRNAVTGRQFDYCTNILNQLQKYRIQANVLLIELLEEARAHAIKDLKELEDSDSAQAAKEIRERKVFLQRYNVYLRLAPSPLKNKKEDKRNPRPDVASMLL